MRGDRNEGRFAWTSGDGRSRWSGERRRGRRAYACRLRRPWGRARHGAGLGRGGAGGGFTLVELLVCVAIIGMLMAILTPTVGRAIELARRAKCAANLWGIGNALSLYGTEHGRYPVVPLNGAGWQVKIGESRDVDPAGGAERGRNPTSCLYELVRRNICQTEMFICPSSSEDAKVLSGDFWDFADGSTISYAVMNPYGTAHTFEMGVSVGVPLLADGSPYFDGRTGLRNEVPVADLAAADETEARAGNSVNHGRDGQNVSFAGGATWFRYRADVGVNLDNIYTRADAAAGTDPAGSIPSAGPNGMAADQGPAGPNDSFLVP